MKYSHRSKVYPRCKIYTREIQNTKRQPTRPKPRAAHGPARDLCAALGLGRAGCRLVFCFILRILYMLDMSWTYLDISLVKCWYSFGISVGIFFVHRCLVCCLVWSRCDSLEVMFGLVGDHLICHLTAFSRLRSCSGRLILLN